MLIHVGLSSQIKYQLADNSRTTTDAVLVKKMHRSRKEDTWKKHPIWSAHAVSRFFDVSHTEAGFEPDTEGGGRGAVSICYASHFWGDFYSLVLLP